jgi:hypothetical protein
MYDMRFSREYTIPRGKGNHSIPRDCTTPVVKYNGHVNWHTTGLGLDVSPDNTVLAVGTSPLLQSNLQRATITKCVYGMYILVSPSGPKSPKRRGSAKSQGCNSPKRAGIRGYGSHGDIRWNATVCNI